MSYVITFGQEDDLKSHFHEQWFKRKCKFSGFCHNFDTKTGCVIFSALLNLSHNSSWRSPFPRFLSFFNVNLSLPFLCWVLLNLDQPKVAHIVKKEGKNSISWFFDFEILAKKPSREFNLHFLSQRNIFL